MSAVIPATLIPGDGIGPEIVDATLAALDALGAPFDWDRQIAGLGGVQAAGDPLPPATLDSIRRTRLALKGPLETPSGGGYRSLERAAARGVPALRQPAPGAHHHSRRPLRQHRPDGRAREPRRPVHRPRALRARSTTIRMRWRWPPASTPRQGSRRLLEYAFEHAIATGRKKVTIVHKANIMKALTGIFLETAQDLYERKYKGQYRARHGDHRRLRDEAGAQPLAVRRAGHDQPVRRHPVRPGRRPGRRPRHGAGRQHRRRCGDLRSGARLGARHRRQGHRQSRPRCCWPPR